MRADQDRPTVAPGPQRLVISTSAVIAALVTAGALLPGRAWLIAAVWMAAALAATAALLWSRADFHRRDTILRQQLGPDIDPTSVPMVEAAPEPSGTIVADAAASDSPPSMAEPPAAAAEAPQAGMGGPPQAVAAEPPLAAAQEPATPPPGTALPVSVAGPFPVLRKPSQAATKPWLLPREPSGPGIAADEAALGGLKIRAASIVGPGHRVDARPRQDAYRIGRDSAGQHLIVAVADGMSDSQYADIGANVAVVTMVTVLRAALDGGAALEDLDAVELFTAAAGQMYHTATQRNWEPDDVRAVAVAAVVPVSPDPDGVRRAWVASVGDASAWLLLDGKWLQVVGDVKGGPDPSRVYSFLPHVVDQVDSRRCEVAADQALVLMSDGVSDALELGPDAADWFAERWRRPPPVASFLLDVGFDQAQMLDDRTAVAVWCSDGR